MAILMYWAVSWFEKVVLKGFMHGAQSAGR